MHHIHHFLNCSLELAVSGWIRDHKGAEVLSVLFNLLLHVVQVHIARLGGFDDDHFHATHSRRSGVGAMGRHGNETNIPLVVPSALVVATDG